MKVSLKIISDGKELMVDRRKYKSITRRMNKARNFMEACHVYFEDIKKVKRSMK